MKQVLIPTKLDPIAGEILTREGWEVIHDPDSSLDELAGKYPEASALIVRSNKVTAEVIDAFPHLQLVVRAGSGYNTIDIKHARRRGIDVMNTPGANSNAVAEEVVAMILAHYRHVVPGDISTRAGRWEKKQLMGRELTGKTVGIVGLGNIGQLVVKRLEGFDSVLLGYDPVVSARRAEEIGVRLVDLETLFSESDVVTLHVPETDETVGMINRTLLSRMKPGALLVNCARAGILEEDDLRQIKEEKNLGFCNDVYAADEAGEKSVTDIADLMLPHLGASTLEANQNAARRAAEQLIAYFERGVTKYVVNKGVPDGLDEAYQQLAYRIACVARHYLGTGDSVRRVECSFYGGLDEYTKWLVPPIVAGISADFDAFQDMEDAEEYLSAKGVEFEVREPDESKGYGKSITVDLLEGRDKLRQVSIRGTIAENNLVVSRINNFDKLYIQPQGNNLIVEYRDRPGVLAAITGACAEANINIEDIRAPRDSSATYSLAVLRTDQPVPETVVKTIRETVEPEVAFALSMP